jgi:hypothetical protein
MLSVDENTKGLLCSLSNEMETVEEGWSCGYTDS